MEEPQAEVIDPTQDPVQIHPLKLACDAGDEAKARELLESGTDLKTFDENGSPFLLSCCSSGSLPLLNLLLDHGASLSSENITTLCSVAAAHGHLPLLEFLLNKASDLDVKTACNFTSLFNACEFGKEDILAFLLDRGVSLDRTDTNDRTALMIAASKGQPKIAEILLEKGC